MFREAADRRRNVFGKKIEQVELIHEILDHRQYIDLLESSFKLLHNAFVVSVVRRLDIDEGFNQPHTLCT